MTSTPMRFKMIFTPEGKTITEVLDKGTHVCGNIRQITTSLGREVSDEQIGPECDTVNEIANE